MVFPNSQYWDNDGSSRSAGIPFSGSSRYKQYFCHCSTSGCRGFYPFRMYSAFKPYGISLIEIGQENVTWKNL